MMELLYSYELKECFCHNKCNCLIVLKETLNIGGFPLIFHMKYNLRILKPQESLIKFNCSMNLITGGKDFMKLKGKKRQNSICIWTSDVSHVHVFQIVKFNHKITTLLFIHSSKKFWSQTYRKPVFSFQLIPGRDTQRKWSLSLPLQSLSLKAHEFPNVLSPFRMMDKPCQAVDTLIPPTNTPGSGSQWFFQAGSLPAAIWMGYSIWMLF